MTSVAIFRSVANNIDPALQAEADALLRLWAKHAPASQSEFGAKYGIGSQGMVWQYLHGKRALNLKAAAAFSTGLGVQIKEFSPRLAAEAETLMRGLKLATPGLSAGVTAATELTHPGEEAAAPDWQDFGEPLSLPVARAVPVVGTAQLGDNGHYVELEYPVGNGDGAVLAITGDSNSYAVRCRGDSMQPRLQHGEFAVIEPNHEVLPGDEVLVKSADGRVMIKRLRYVRDGRAHLDSVNDAAHPPVIIALHDIAAMHYVAAIVKSTHYRAG